MDRTHRTASLISAGLIIIVLLIGVSMYMSSRENGEESSATLHLPAGEYRTPVGFDEVAAKIKLFEEQYGRYVG